MKKNVIVRNNHEYDYFGNVLEYEYDYFPSYSSMSTSTQKVLVLEYEYKYTSTITPSLKLSRPILRLLSLDITRNLEKNKITVDRSIAIGCKFKWVTNCESRSRAFSPFPASIMLNRKWSPPSLNIIEIYLSK